MGALCGKQSHFQSAGEGHKLGSGSPASTPNATSNGYTTIPSPKPGTPGASERSSASPSDTARREAIAKAAEERNKAVCFHAEETC